MRQSKRQVKDKVKKDKVKDKVKKSGLNHAKKVTKKGQNGYNHPKTKHSRKQACGRRQAGLSLGSEMPPAPAS